MSGTLAINDAGEALAFDGKDWKPAPMAQNDKGEKVYFDGSAWRGATPQAAAPSPVMEGLKSIGNAVNTGVNWAGTQLTKGAAELAGAPATLGDLGRRGFEWAGEQVGAPDAGKAAGGTFKSQMTFGGIVQPPEVYKDAVFKGLGVPEVDAGNRPALTLKQPFGIDATVDLGKMADSAVRAIPGALALGGGALPAAIGGVTSEAAGQATAGSPWEPYARVAGALPGAFVGAKATTPLPSALTPEQTRLVALAQEKGIPLTVGQETGRGRAIESALSRFPTSQGRMASFADDQATAVNRDALKAAGAVGDRLDPTTMNSVVRKASNEFEAVKNSSGDVNLGTDFFKSLEKTIGGYLENTPAAAQTPSVVKRASDFVNGPRALTGEQYQEFRRTLNDAASSVTDVGARRALQGMRGALDDAMEASLPADQAAAWREVRHNWANLKILTKSAAGGTTGSRAEGNLSPSALSMALRQRQGADRFATTEGGLNDTARVAGYLADTRPNSGTPQTLAMQSMLTGGPLAAGFAAGGLPGAGLAAAGLALPNLMARGLTGSQGFGWLRDYLANQALPNTSQEVARVPLNLAPSILTDQRGRR